MHACSEGYCSCPVCVNFLESAKFAKQGEHGAGEPKEVLEFGLKIPDRNRSVAIYLNSRIHYVSMCLFVVSLPPCASRP